MLEVLIEFSNILVPKGKFTKPKSLKEIIHEEYGKVTRILVLGSKKYSINDFN